MKIIAFNGSPHIENGATHMMTQALLQGAEDAGAETETIFLSNHKIRYCMGCGGCWVKTPGQCIFKDDMTELQAKFLAADTAVFASPLYIDTVTGQMKTFMDRLFMPLIDHHFEKDEQYGECRHPRRQDRIPKLVALANSGSPEQGQFQALKVLFRRMARNFDMDLVAEIYRGGGAMLFQQGSGFESEAEEYKRLLRKAGREWAGQAAFSEDTLCELEKSYLPESNYVDEYVKTFEGMVDQWIAATGAGKEVEKV